jgi:hypothetical protein
MRQEHTDSTQALGTRLLGSGPPSIAVGIRGEPVELMVIELPELWNSDCRIRFTNVFYYANGIGAGVVRFLEDGGGGSGRPEPDRCNVACAGPRRVRGNASLIH